jgi:hypothetical protein
VRFRSSEPYARPVHCRHKSVEPSALTFWYCLYPGLTAGKRAHSGKERRRRGTEMDIPGAECEYQTMEDV